MPYNPEMENSTYKLSLIAKKASVKPKLKFNALMHLLDEQYLIECFKQLKKHKAPGIDNRTLESYSHKEMRQAIHNLAEDLKAGRYRPQPVRRTYVPKLNGKQRPLGIPTVMDKILQRAVANILEPLFEPLFQDHSYGFRPKRSAHDAVKALNHMVMQEKVNWIIDADIKGFFDHVNHDWLMKCLKERINDPNLLDLIARFLKAGVMEAGKLNQTNEGTPQGGIVSPILANIYLHYVLDLWFEIKDKKQLKGYAGMVRYADDFVIGVQHESEARLLLQHLNDRLAKFDLELAADKTRILEFGRYAKQNRQKRGQGKPETFDFLGFTHYCGVTKDGRYSLKVKTVSKKLTVAITMQAKWLRSMRTNPLKDTWTTLAAKLIGHYNYYGVSGNFDSTKIYYEQTRALAYKWLNRRSQKRSWSWEKFDNFTKQHPLPKPEIKYAIYNTW